MLVVDKKCGWSEGGIELSVSGCGERWKWGWVGVGDGGEWGMGGRKVISVPSERAKVYSNPNCFAVFNN